MQQHTRPVRARSALPQRSLTRPSSRRAPVRLDAAAARWDETGPQRLVIEVRTDLRRPLVEVSGELDLASTGLLTAMLEHVRRSLRRASSAELHRDELAVDVDLTGVTFADSHGIAPVLGGRTRIVAASEPVRRLLRLLREASPTHADRSPRSA